MRPGQFLKTVQWDEIFWKEFELNSTDIIFAQEFAGGF
jgi:hypothetical protein